MGPVQNFTYDRKPKAGGILIYKGRILILQSRGKKWGFPKGGLEHGENVFECAHREVNEETSLQIDFNPDDFVIQLKNTIYFVKFLETAPPRINNHYLRQIGNDCTGICWMRLTCFSELVKKNKMYLNSGAREFARSYIHSNY
jgi:8-oxo-dGTP pyrophosphatase MutT (NUDIX family)